MSIHEKGYIVLRDALNSDELQRGLECVHGKKVDYTHFKQNFIDRNNDNRPSLC